MIRDVSYVMEAKTAICTYFLPVSSPHVGELDSEVQCGTSNCTKDSVQYVLFKLSISDILSNIFGKRGILVFSSKWDMII